MSNSHILILEDEIFVALDLEAIVHKHNPTAEVIVCSSVADARSRINEQIAFALLDVDVLDGKTFEIAAALWGNGIPLTFVSGSSPKDIPPALAEVPFIQKPFSDMAIMRSLESMTISRSSLT